MVEDKMQKKPGDDESNASSGHKVEVTVDGKLHRVYPGPNVVSTFKEIVHVPGSDLLEQKVADSFVALDDDAIIDIKGGEVFTSRMREHKVLVTVGGKTDHVFPGQYIVSTFKEIVKVPASKVLEEVIEKEPRVLDDNALIRIIGGEIFFAHVRTGGSSR